MMSFRVLFSPGFPPGGGFPAEQFLLFDKMRKTTADQHPLVLCVPLEYRRSKKTVS
jgi:hypothetical protein